jgi:hypothetical protein
MDAELPPQDSSDKSTDISPEQDASPEYLVGLNLGHTAFIEIDGKITTPADDPEALKEALIANRDQIALFFDEALRHFQNILHHQDATISYPPLGVMTLMHKLGFKDGGVILPEAYDANMTGGIYYDKGAIKPIFHAFWDALVESGFSPEVRVVASTSSRSEAWLMISPPKTEQARKLLGLLSTE